jgi:hypothetical protein
MVDLISLSVAVAAILLALLSWWEARRHSELLQSMAKSLAYIARTRRSSGKPAATTPPPSSIQQRAEERRSLKLELQREKEQWRRQKDIAKALGWLVDRLSEDEDD